jgi:predicted Fe-S protein YdhL (DUF1289 family)
MTDSEPPSPCINLCTLDRAGVCIGCYRNIDEIARWTTMSAAERRQVIESAGRRRQIARGASAETND